MFMNSASQPQKILVALSGGVDSAVAAYLLKQQGHDVSAAYIRTWVNEGGEALFAECPWEEDIRYAKAVAEHIGIPFEVISLIDAYREKVVAYLLDGYRSGITPNPDIMCNREIKFGVFRDCAMAQGFDAVATGHYCQCVRNDDGSVDLFEGLDKNKDQSYFLAMVRQAQIQNAIFPIGGIAKSRVREIAKDKNFPNAERKDSQGICFLGKVDINAFLAHYIPDAPGDIVTDKGVAVGQHKGLHHFTLGQRRGIGVPSNTDNEHFVVVAKDYDSNQLVVAFESPTAPGLFQTEMSIRSISWVNEAYRNKEKLLAKPRFRDPSQKITFAPDGETCAHVAFEEPQRALAVGQVLALYDGEKLLGGGVYAAPG